MNMRKPPFFLSPPVLPTRPEPLRQEGASKAYAISEACQHIANAECKQKHGLLTDF